MNETGTQRIPQEDKFNKNAICGIMEQAESVARGVLESIQAIAGTTDCKGVQITQLAKWAKQHNCWIDNNKLGSYEDRGSENEVYLYWSGLTVIYISLIRLSINLVTIT